MHQIHFVEELPAGHDFLLATGPDGAVVYYRRSAVTPEVLESSWAAYRAALSAGLAPDPGPEPARAPQGRPGLVAVLPPGTLRMIPARERPFELVRAS